MFSECMCLVAQIFTEPWECLLNVMCCGRCDTTFYRRAGQEGVDEVYAVREAGRCHVIVLSSRKYLCNLAAEASNGEPSEWIFSSNAFLCFIAVRISLRMS